LALKAALIPGTPTNPELYPRRVASIISIAPWRPRPIGARGKSSIAKFAASVSPGAERSGTRRRTGDVAHSDRDPAPRSSEDLDRKCRAMRRGAQGLPRAPTRAGISTVALMPLARRASRPSARGDLSNLFRGRFLGLAAARAPVTAQETRMPKQVWARRPQVLG